METVLRIVLIYVFVMLGLRLIGKRELSQLAPRELVMLLLIPELFSQGALGEDFSLTNAFIACSTLLVLVFGVSLVTHLTPGVDGFISAKPAVLVEHGSIVEDNMNRERVTPDELLAEMRLIGIRALSDVEWAILEADGKISFIATAGAARHRGEAQQSLA